MSAPLPRESGPAMAYAAYCGECAGMIVVSVDTPPYAKENAKTVADCIRHGMRVERVSCASIRDGSAGKLGHVDGCTRQPKRRRLAVPPTPGGRDNG